MSLLIESNLTSFHAFSKRWNMHRMDQYFMRLRNFYRKVKQLMRLGTLWLSKREMHEWRNSSICEFLKSHCCLKLHINGIESHRFWSSSILLKKMTRTTYGYLNFIYFNNIWNTKNHCLGLPLHSGKFLPHCQLQLVHDFCLTCLLPNFFFLFSLALPVPIAFIFCLDSLQSNFLIQWVLGLDLAIFEELLSVKLRNYYD